MTPTRRLRDLMLVLAWLSGVSLEAQTRRTERDQERLDSLLLDQASRLLERYGDTFYVLGLYIATDGELEASRRVIGRP